jgi:hypothetical protein
MGFKRFETSHARVSDEAVARMVSALEGAGIIFVEQNGDGPGTDMGKGKG